MQIADIAVPTNAAGSTTVVLKPDFARKDEARWQQDSLPVIGRVSAVYHKRPPVKGTELEKHTIRVTFPTLKSVVTDPDGPYTPPPVVDYVSVAELSVWLHPRATAGEREQAYAVLTRTATNMSFENMLLDVVKSGNSLY